MAFCPDCRTELPNGVENCEICGAKAVDVLPVRTHIAPKSKPKTHAKTSKKSFKLNLNFLKNIKLPKNFKIKIPENLSPKFITFGIAAVSILLVATILISILIPAKLPNGYMFATNNGLNYAKVGSDTQQKVTTEIISGSSSIAFSVDGSKFFYVEDKNEKLMYKTVSNIGKGATSLATNVKSFAANNDGSIVTYIKGSDRDLFQYNLKHKEQGDKIDDNVTWFITDKKGKKILYAKKNFENIEELWVYTANKKESVKITTGFSNYFILNDNLKSLIFTKNEAIYIYKEGSEAQKVVDSHTEVICTYETGEFYYYSIKLYDNKKKYLYYYNGEESILLCDNYTDYRDYAFDKPVLLYYLYYPGTNNFDTYIAVGSNTAKFDISVNDAYLDAKGENLRLIAYEKEDSTEGTLYGAKVSKNGYKSLKEIDTGVIYGDFVNDGKFFYFKNFDSELQTAELYYNNKKVDTDVSMQKVYYMPSRNALAFFKDVESGSGTMFIYDNGKSKEIDQNVRISEVFVTEKEAVVYLRDYSITANKGNLYVCEKKKGELVFEGVSSIVKYKTQFKQKLEKRGYII